MEKTPSVSAEVVYLAREEGGRATPPCSGYMPHIVVQDRTVRTATRDQRGWSNESYLGIRLTDCPSGYNNGNAGDFTFDLMYHPRVDYSDVIPGAKFTVREGGHIVGHGIVLSRSNP
jgi:translation elongation factor EF-Tu-like GTPase